MSRVPRLRWWGAVVGLALAAFDTALARAIGVDMRLGARDLTPHVFAYLALSFGVFGYILGLAIEARRRERLAAAAEKARAAELAAVRVRLAQIEKLASLGQLATAIAHEVRNPLAIIRSWVQNLVEGLPPEAARQAETTARCVKEEIDRLTRVTATIVSFARPLPVRRARVTAADVFERTEVLARKLFEGKTVVFRQVPPPPERPAVALDVDLDLVCQALLGILGNAADFSPRGGAVVFEGRRADGAFEFVVSDEGQGVPPELRERIFEPFFTTRETGGGLGLAIARQIASANGGRIEVADRPGGGASFVLRLDCAGAATGAAAA